MNETTQLAGAGVEAPHRQKGDSPNGGAQSDPRLAEIIAQLVERTSEASTSEVSMEVEKSAGLLRVETLFVRYFEGLLTAHGAEVEDFDLLNWPVGSEEILDHIRIQERVDPAWEPLHDDDSPVLRMALEALIQLPREEQCSGLKFLLHQAAAVGSDGQDMIEPLTNSISESTFSVDLYAELLRFLAEVPHIEGDGELEYVPLTVIREVGHDMHFFESLQNTPHATLYEDLMFDLTVFGFNTPLFFKALTRLTQEERDSVLGSYIMYKGSYADTLNALRGVLETGDLALKEKVQLEALGKVLLGFNPDDPRSFHTCLADVYKNADMGSYEGYVSTQEADEEVLLRELGDRQNPRVLDVGSGDGRLALALAKQEGIRVTGVDVNNTEVAKAQRAAAGAGLASSVEFKRGSMHRLPIPDASVDIMYTLGRTVTHDETEKDFIKTIQEARRVLEPGGVWIFDVPNPNVGEVLQARIRTARVCASLGINVVFVPNPDRPGTPMPYVKTIVDSPNGVDFYNRRTPQIAEVQELLQRYGFASEVVLRTPLRGPSYGKADQNIYVRAWIRETSQDSEPQSMQGPTGPEPSELYLDGV